MSLNAMRDKWSSRLHWFLPLQNVEGITANDIAMQSERSRRNWQVTVRTALEREPVNFRRCQGTFTFVFRQGSSATYRISLRSALSRSALASRWHRSNRCLSHESTDTTYQTYICTRIVCESLNRILPIHSSNIDNRVREMRINANIIRELRK